jgi:hypothetical protein
MIGENVNSMCMGKKILDFLVYVITKSILNTVYNGQRDLYIDLIQQVSGCIGFNILNEFIKRLGDDAREK